MELKETIEMMESTDYKERFKAEYLQLRIRMQKLRNFINKINYAIEHNMEEPKHDCPLDLLLNQLNTMGDYAYFLNQRAKMENIVLEELE